MNHDFDDELRRSTERRSRRNPRMKDPADTTGREGQYRTDSNARQTEELNILGDASVKPLPRQTGAKRTQAGAPDTQTADRTTGRRVYRGEMGSGRTTDDGERISRYAARETAAGAGRGGLPPHMEEKLARRKRRRRIITMIVAECLALVCIFSYAAFAKKYNMVQRPEFDERNVVNNDIDMDTEERMKGYWTIAVFGVDARDRAIAKGTNADVNMICNINLDTGEIKLVSVFRDTYLNISDKGSYNKINQAYFLGGPEQAVAALNRNLDLNMTSYMTFNWKAVADGINVLGGVDIELSKAEFYYINSFITETVKATGIGSKHLTKAGMNHLDGVQAVAYGRLRLMDTDYARTERQRKIIAQAFEKAKAADFNTLNTLIGAVFPQVATNIGVDDLVKNASILNKFHMGESTGFPQARGDANMGKKGAVVVPQTLESNVTALHKFLFGVDDYVPTDTVKRLSAKIAEDSGMYREGKYIDSVGTGGGVIQPPKTTAAATKAAEDDDEDDEDEETTAETSRERPTRTTEVETDEDGRPIEVETVRPGDPTESGSSRPGETTESGSARPGGSTESSSSRPGGSTESSSSRPGGNTESSASRPGGNTESSASRPGGNTESSASRPGGNTESTASRPGGITESTASRPGGNTESSVASTEGPSSARPGREEPTTSIPQFPGSNTGSGETIGNNGPGGQGSSQTNPSTTGTISAPGQ